MFKFTKNKKQKGVTLLETIFVLSLISIIIAGAMKIYYNVNRDVKIRKTLTDISSLAYDINVLYSSKGSYNASLGGDTSRLEIDALTAGIISNDMVDPSFSSGIRHSLGGELLLYGWNDHFDIDLRDISKESCIKLTISDIGFYQLYINGWINESELPLSVSDAADDCSNDTDNRVIFRFR